MKLPIKNKWTALTTMLSDPELVWKMEDEGELWPDVYNSENDVWKSIADDQIQQLQQFIDDERDWDEVDWEPDSYPVQIDIDEDGEMVIKDSEGGAIFVQSLKEWRESL